MKVFNLFASLLILTFAGISCKTNSFEDITEAEPVYFKVGETEHVRGDSFIISLTDPDHIAHARALIEDPSTITDRIVVARIVRQTGNEEYLNKDLDKNLVWSWRVESFESFGFNTIEILDGWPGYIEEDIERWFQNTSGENDHGFIGFWNYTVLSEVSKSELE